jgi:predicted O-methyltransferase YrrM
MYIPDELVKYAKANYVPIARVAVVEYLNALINEKNYKSMLEIGTAIGFTSICLKLANKLLNIVTIEKDNEMFEIASNNFKIYQVEVLQIQEDATYFYSNNQYDLIFIDANKANNILYLKRFLNNLNVNGTIIIDNVALSDLPDLAKEKKQKKYLLMQEKFLNELSIIPNINYQILNIGDGIAIITKK